MVSQTCLRPSKSMPTGRYSLPDGLRLHVNHYILLGSLLQLLRATPALVL